MRITSTITIEASRITTSVPMSSSPKNRRSRSAISSSSGKRRQILADGLVPDARVRSVGVVVDVSERMDERTQRKLEVECSRGARDAAEGVAPRLVRGQVSAIEPGRIFRDRASAEVGHLVALVPAVRGPEHKGEVGDGGPC